MSSAVYLVIDQGATFSHEVTLRDDNEVPLDFTGATALLHARETIDSADPTLTLRTEDNTLTLGPGGRLGIFIADEVTATYNFSTLVFDVLVTLANGDKSRFLQESIFKLSKGVTRVS